jgi:hypothetical protein
MVEHPWPLKNSLPIGHSHFTKAELIELLAHVEDDETPIWIDNYWQLRRQITQRPIELMYAADDGFHIG